MCLMNPDRWCETTTGSIRTKVPRFGHRSHAFFVFAIALAFCGGITRPAHSDDEHKSKIYDSNGFEPKPFIAGSPLLGVDGWSTAIPPFLNPCAATMTRAANSNGRQSVEVWGGDLVGYKSPRFES